ncbi:acetoacetate decarboxylase family protein [Methanosarcina sp.]|uniref:acetoacetate decarboxylase family protein n=1 Tax=Methanosarcina sp. TaxID=2213 RepID=UPI003C733559
MFRFEDNKCYRMPAHFGGFDCPGPDAALYYRDAVSVTFAYTTDKDQLESYVPEGFELLRPKLNISYSQFREIDWMAGGAYNLVQVSVPTRFNGKRDRLEGQFILVVWENKTAPILGGREETGIPKIYADIEDLHTIQPNYYTTASHEGNTFLRLEMLGAKPVEGQLLADAQASAATVNALGWRYIPKVGAPGADLSQPILYPQGAEIHNAWAGNGTVKWTQLSWEQNPMQWHIIKALAELPVLEMSSAIMTKGIVILKPNNGRVLE